MSVRCKHVEEALAAGTAEELGADALLQKHLSGCSPCAELEDALAIVDESLAALPPIDPPAALIASVLTASGSNVPSVQLVHSGPGRAESDEKKATPARADGRLGRALAAGGVFAAAAAVVLVSASNFIASSQPGSSQATAAENSRATDVTSTLVALPVKTPEPSIIDPSRGKKDMIAFAREAGILGALDGDQLHGYGGGQRGEAGRDGKQTGLSLEALDETSLFRVQLDGGRYRIEGQKFSTPVDVSEDINQGFGFNAPSDAPSSTPSGTLSNIDATTTGTDVPANGAVVDDRVRSPLRGAKTGEAVNKKGKPKGNDSWLGGDLGNVSTVTTEGVASDFRDEKKEQLAHKDQRGDVSKPTPDEGERAGGNNEALGTETTDQRAAARAFVAERRRHLDVPTVSADGFWSNNYIPGDPRLRLLAARLARDPIAARLGALDASVAPHPQAFDAPRSSALAVSLRSDIRATEGPARMLLQVGIKATARQSGARPPLNIGVVLDLAAATDETEAAMRNVLSALRDAKRRGDRFSLTVANRPGGLVLAPDQFRNGPLRVAMQALFSDTPVEPSSDQATLDLAGAVTVATAQVASGDEPDGPLGRSMVIVVTGSSSSSAVAGELEALAHANATGGIGLSTIGVGTAIDDAQLLRWAAAGHGNHRLLTRPDDAGRVISTELASAQAVVARALRVRIKLAPGVKLVEVVGADRLDAAAAARTREAEKSIDRRVARARGIAADREQDDDGIKVIIPSFSAGDSHVILLDVIADGPGAIADVAVAYKDLVHLRNGSATASLSLSRGDSEPGQLERGVFQSYVALAVAEHLADAGARLGRDDRPGAERVIAELDDLLRGLRLENSWLRKDAAFERDVATVARFRGVLQGGVAEDARAYVARSLSYAAWRKIVRVRREAN